jgi:hypothetical protein
MYDTILADYLIGAVDGFSPYEQDNIIKKLKDHLNPEGRLYFIGMNPIPDEPALPTKIISEVRQARDAAILLAGHRMYREFPLTWMLRHISNVGLESTAHKKYTIMHSEVSVTRQIKVLLTCFRFAFALLYFCFAFALLSLCFRFTLFRFDFVFRSNSTSFHSPPHSTLHTPHSHSHLHSPHPSTLTLTSGGTVEAFADD